MNREEYATRLGAALGLLSAAYDRAMSPEQSAAYVLGLGDLPIDAIEEGVARCIRTVKVYGQKLPQIAELRELIEGSPADQAAIAWAGVRSAVGAVGPYASLAVEDASAAVGVLSTFGSWPSACEMHRTQTEPLLVAKFKEFAAAYRLAQRQQAHGWRILDGSCAIVNAGRRCEGRRLRFIVGVLRSTGHAFTRVVEHDEELRPLLPPAAIAALPARAAVSALPPTDVPPVAREEFYRRLEAAVAAKGMA